MKFYQLILLPFSWIYGLILSLRNLLYNARVFKSYTPKIPSVVVGNLSMGGTGKTPMIQLLCSWLKDYNVVVISRGYGRKTRGLFEVFEDSLAQDIGDEPLEIKKAFPKVKVWVCEDRVKATQHIEDAFPETDIILFDDAFQHRKIKAHYNVLLSLSTKPYFHDFVVPSGTLREFRKGASRADYTVFTKVHPQVLKNSFKLQHEQYSQKPFTFSSYVYKALDVDSKSTPLLVTGIANTSSIEKHLEANGISFEHLKYKDHYDFKTKDLEDWMRKLKKRGHFTIICTAKDAVKINQFEHPFELKVVQIKHHLEDQETLKKDIYGLIHK